MPEPRAQIFVGTTEITKIVTQKVKPLRQRFAYAVQQPIRDRKEDHRCYYCGGLWLWRGDKVVYQTPFWAIVLQLVLLGQPGDEEQFLDILSDVDTRHHDFDPRKVSLICGRCAKLYWPPEPKTYERELGGAVSIHKNVVQVTLNQMALV
jgi:hypothetical protein